jgi:micrococcal nuclease
VRLIAVRVAIALLVLAAVAVGSRVAAPDGGTAGDRVRSAVVTRVVDGDTVILSGVGRSRLIGVDTPEVHGGAECYGREASAFAKRLLTGRRVRYELGTQPRDRYGRALVYLTLAGGAFVNELLVMRGYARPLAIAPNVRYAVRFRERAREARAGRRGLWSARACS